MDHKLSLKRVGCAVSSVAVLMHIAALLRISMLTGAERELADKIVGLGHPGYVSMNAGHVLIVLIEAFVYAWIISTIFVTVYNTCEKK